MVIYMSKKQSVFFYYLSNRESLIHFAFISN